MARRQENRETFPFLFCVELRRVVDRTEEERGGRGAKRLLVGNMLRLVCILLQDLLGLRPEIGLGVDDLGTDVRGGRQEGAVTGFENGGDLLEGATLGLVEEEEDLKVRQRSESMESSVWEGRKYDVRG